MSEVNEVKPVEAIIPEKVEPIAQAETPVNTESNKESSETKEDPNWRAFREARKQDRIAKEAAERKAAEKEAEAAALKAAMEAAFSKIPQRGEDTSQYANYEETEEQRIERKVNEAIAARDAQFRREQEERERQSAPQRIKQTYPDFNQVVNQDNCDYIDYHFPELSKPFEHMPDGFDKWSAMYNLIKKFVPNATTAKRESARVDANMAKPKSMSAPAMTQSQQVPGSSNIISEERKAANWERMRKTMNSVS